MQHYLKIFFKEKRLFKKCCFDTREECTVANGAAKTFSLSLEKSVLREPFVELQISGRGSTSERRGEIKKALLFPEKHLFKARRRQVAMSFISKRERATHCTSYSILASLFYMSTQN